MNTTETLFAIVLSTPDGEFYLSAGGTHKGGVLAHCTTSPGRALLFTSAAEAVDNQLEDGRFYYNGRQSVPARACEVRLQVSELPETIKKIAREPAPLRQPEPVSPQSDEYAAMEPTPDQLDMSVEAMELVQSSAQKTTAADPMFADGPQGPDLFELALKQFVKTAQGIINEYYRKSFIKLQTPQLSYNLADAKKYVRIVRKDYPEATGGSVHCFVDMTNGDVLMAAGWKKPAKHARGNIYKLDPKCLTPHGTVYLR